MSETETEVVETVKKNKGGRPRKAAVTTASGPSFTDEQFQQLIGVLAQKNDSGGGIDPALIKQLMESAAIVSAQATEKAANPSNKNHPGISAFSYPEGDVKRPRPVPKCEIWWNGFAIHRAVETHHWRELELLNELEPGDYQTMRKDGSPAPDRVKVEGTRDANGKLSRMDVRFSVNREERHYIAPMHVMVYQMVHPELSPKESFWRGWQEWMSIQMDMPVPVAG
jgi:hypothetical protein